MFWWVFIHFSHLFFIFKRKNLIFVVGCGANHFHPLSPTFTHFHLLSLTSTYFHLLSFISSISLFPSTHSSKTNQSPFTTPILPYRKSLQGAVPFTTSSIRYTYKYYVGIDLDIRSWKLEVGSWKS